MKTLVYNGPWDMSLEVVPDPTPVAGEVLLKIQTVGICGSDVHGFTGESGRRRPGMIMGHEACGKVIELADDVSGLQVGDSVAVFPSVPCRDCEFCVAGREQLCETKEIIGVNLDDHGAMAEYMTYPADGLHKLAPEIDPAIGLLAEPIGVGMHAIKLMKPEPDDVIAIVGGGMIGTGLTIALKAHGLQNVFVLDMIPEKLELVASFGAHPINIKTEDPAAVMQKIAGRPTANGAFEAVGRGPTVRSAFDLLGTGGTLVVIGNLDQEFTLPMQLVTWRETIIRGSYGFSCADFKDAVDLINQGNIDLTPLITGRCTLEEAPEIMTKLGREEMQATKMVICP